MKFRVAAVSFLNTVPLIDSLVALADGSVEICRDLPSRQAELLASGAADVALLPVVELFRGRAAGVISRTGIACLGAVDSVRLFHRGPLSEVRSVAADRGSRTSVALLDILFREQFGVKLRLTEIEPIAGTLPGQAAGVLVIGDRCFEYEKRMQESVAADLGVYDLGLAWQQMTGLPFVFATWAASAAFVESATTAEIACLADLLDRARDDGISRLDELASREAARGALGHKGEATAAAVAYYFRESLRYRLGDEEMAGLARFHELCVKHGVVPAGPAPLLL